MDLAASHLYDLCTPVGAFPNRTDQANELAKESVSAIKDPKKAWKSSALNPLHRLKSSHNAKWRIDGCGKQGTQFFAVPQCLLPRLPPLRIVVTIPDQTKLDSKLRKDLDVNCGFCLHDSRVTRLGISQYIVNLLEFWSESDMELLNCFRTLPFGSRIMAENLAIDFGDVKLHVVPNEDLYSQLLSMPFLKKNWEIPDQTWPASLDVGKLQYHQQLHDTVTLVKIPHLSPTDIFVFKSNIESVKHMYHELRLLLTMALHQHVMQLPLFLITTAYHGNSEQRVCGFILPYYPMGTLGDIIAERVLQSKLCLRDQIRWSRQIATTLVAINQSPAQFYSELKPFNLLLSRDTNGLENVIFIDFEQHNGWITFSAPEVTYLRFCTRLAKSKRVPPEKRVEYDELLRSLLSLPSKDDHDYGHEHLTASSGYNIIWNSWTKSEQEAAEVFSLGKILWCIFEGCCDTRNSIHTAYRNEPILEFPQFRRTPTPVQDIIKKCTAGCAEWRARKQPRIIRIGSKVYPSDRTGVGNSPLATAEETMEAARLMWLEIVSEMEVYLYARKAWNIGDRRDDYRRLLGFPDRPSLQEVIRFLEKLEAS